MVSQVALANSPWWKMSSSSSPCVGLRYTPSLRTNLSAFHSDGLCPPVIAMPPSAFNQLTANCKLGVGQTPRSKTSQPAVPQERQNVSLARMPWYRDKAESDRHPDTCRMLERIRQQALGLMFPQECRGLL